MICLFKKIKQMMNLMVHPKRFFYPNNYSNERLIEYLKSKGAVIGKNTRFITPTQCHIDPGRVDYITIGNNCCLSNVTILAHDYSWYTFLDAFNDIIPDPGGEVIIGDNVFVGYKACILKNTKIGNNVIIGARAVVKGHVPSNTVWAGVPAKQICTLEDYYKKRLSLKISDALYRRDHIKNRYHRNPTIEEMGFFSFLFLNRTDENYKKYIRKLEINGQKESLKVCKLFFTTTQLFKSFDDFLSFKN